MKKKNKVFLSVVIPAYNEVSNLRNKVLDEVYNYLKKQNYSWEVLVVNDGSTDDTSKMVLDFVKRHKNFYLYNEPHRGKAATVIAGMLKAKGEIILFTDMDQATPIDQLEKILPEFDNNVDIVIGSRSGREGAPLVRRAMAAGFSILRYLILRLPYKDTQCGFKAFKKNAARVIFKKMKVFRNNQQIKGSAVKAGFDLELLYIARKLSLQVREVPVKWHHKGTVRVNPIKDSIDGLFDLIKVRLNSIMGKYKI
ncbi:MAG: glycosyltransferase family 2 protein [Patescibacteria group bacterium]|nr:glycosyltransferase family 2 protein [Patescibacteria group bacterium]